MEKEDIISVQRAQEDVETSYNLLNNNVGRSHNIEIADISFKVGQN